MPIDTAWAKRVHTAARHDGRRKAPTHPPRLLLAAIIARAVDDLLEDGPVAVDAAAYFVGPVYRHHVTQLGLPADALPAGVDEAMLHELLAAALPRSMLLATEQAGDGDDVAHPKKGLAVQQVAGLDELVHIDRV